MTCPKCGYKQTGIAKTVKETDCVRRVRECSQCLYKFTTIEVEEEIVDKLYPKGGLLSD